MKHRGDAVADRLAVAVDERDVDREIHAGARHHLPLEGVAMDVDDARQHQQAARVDRDRRASAAVDLCDVLARDGQRGLGELRADQGPATFKENIGHARALPLRDGGWLARALASYFARKSSIPSLRKSGSA